MIWHDLLMIRAGGRRVIVFPKARQRFRFQYVTGDRSLPLPTVSVILLNAVPA